MTNHLKIDTTCTWLPVVHVIRACRSCLDVIAKAREEEFAQIVEKKRVHKPLFGKPRTRSHAEALALARAHPDADRLHIRYGAQEDRAKTLKAMAEATPEDKMLVAREDFEMIRSFYDPAAVIEASPHTA